MPPANNFTERSDQWDIRINVQDEEWLELFIIQLEEYCNEGTVRYLHVSSIERGDVPGRTSFNKLHVHIALILHL